MLGTMSSKQNSPIPPTQESNKDSKQESNKDSNNTATQTIAKSFSSAKNIFGLENSNKDVLCPIQNTKEEQNNILNIIKTRSLNFDNPGANFIKNPPILEQPQDKVPNRPIIPTISSASKMYTSYDIHTKKFNLLDNNKSSIGYFTIDHIITYLTQTVIGSNKEHMSSDYTTKIKELIEKYIFSIEYNNKIKSAHIKLKDYNESPLMGDLETIMNLNKGLEQFEIDNKDKVDPKVSEILKQLRYLLLNYTVWLTNSAYGAQSNQAGGRAVKDELFNYSIKNINKINSYVQGQLETAIKNNQKLEKMMYLSIRLKTLVNNKLDKLDQTLNTNMQGGKALDSIYSQEAQTITPSDQDQEDSASISEKEVVTSTAKSESESEYELSNNSYDFSKDNSYVGHIDRL